MNTARHTWEIITVQVLGTGIGMTAVEEQQIFTDLFRSGTLLKAAIRGAGLWLAITKNNAETYHGPIVPLSESGRGTATTHTLPR